MKGFAFGPVTQVKPSSPKSEGQNVQREACTEKLMHGGKLKTKQKKPVQVGFNVWLSCYGTGMQAVIASLRDALGLCSDLNYRGISCRYTTFMNDL